MQQTTARVRIPTEARQSEIVTAVLALTALRAPASITTGDIAGLMGLTQGAVFRHFPSKDAIWLAVMAHIENNLHAVLENAEHQAPTPWDGLHAVFLAHVRFVVAHPGVPRLIFSELQQPEDTPVKARVRSLLQRYRQLLLRLLSGVEARGQLGIGVDHGAAASLFIGTVQGLVMQSMLAGSCEFMEVEAERVFALYQRAIGACA
ncbi:Transcriptional regulator, TetR family [Candidatus Propionivibrio aalborgensis]|uniref:Transcriptional regulator, TetR family n=1 Tax=Candidatus Propionivibrio aalborgensis TaxID=1860101 RepID=A0A1A8XH65_9RHOO|nr:TetR/AcrR family transcriptional regulator [Candidatus Propionivibrio aalborgensis]MBK9027782.1 TetR/AcrR family transcriptional regulator [Propionivibrio sp.]SBT04500.1 Transcriptional regulator, TetR family [Candidatus Propionivibrio aalborgensis]